MKYVYKIVCAVMAVAVVGIMFFSPLMGLRIESPAVSIVAALEAQKGSEEILDKMVANDGEIPSHISETVSLYDVFFGDTSTLLSGLFDVLDLEDNDAIQSLKGPFGAFFAALVLLALCAIATIIAAFFSKNNRRVIYCAISGIGAYMLSTACFSAIEDAFVSGRILFTDIIEEVWAALLGGKVVNFELLEPFGFVPVIFAGVIVWTLLYNFTLTPEEKRERKLMMGEAD